MIILGLYYISIGFMYVLLEYMVYNRIVKYNIVEFDAGTIVTGTLIWPLLWVWYMFDGVKYAIQRASYYNNKLGKSKNE